MLQIWWRFLKGLLHHLPCNTLGNTLQCQRYSFVPNWRWAQTANLGKKPSSSYNYYKRMTFRASHVFENDPKYFWLFSKFQDSINIYSLCFQTIFPFLVTVIKHMKVCHSPYFSGKFILCSKWGNGSFWGFSLNLFIRCSRN